MEIVLRQLLCFCLLFLGGAAWSSHAAVVVLEWDANLETNLAGYRVYRGGTPRSYQSVTDVGNVTACTNDYALGQHFLAVTAYNTDGLESGFSEELALLIVPPPTPRFESNTLTWTGCGSWRVRWTTDTTTNTQIFTTNRVALGMFPAGSTLTVQRHGLGATIVLSDYSVPLHFDPPAVTHAIQVRVFLEKSGGVGSPFSDFAEASFFDAAGEPAFYRARLEITRSGLRLRNSP